ncbi:hypothetical protein SDC9_73755 [bioreactor metagenome]|uniref:Uncharacterized protein n=1 Tax=bioreactor metagenome TaxID=1076179 RepID=A0A644YF82_9ZZZZ
MALFAFDILINQFFCLFKFIVRNHLLNNLLTESFNLQVFFNYPLRSLSIISFLVKVDFAFQNLFSLIGTFIRKFIKQLILHDNIGFRISIFRQIHNQIIKHAHRSSVIFVLSDLLFAISQKFFRCHTTIFVCFFKNTEWLIQIIFTDISIQINIDSSRPVCILFNTGFRYQDCFRIIALFDILSRLL